MLSIAAKLIYIELMKEDISDYWAISPSELMLHLKTSETGLSSSEAKARLAQFGPNALRSRKKSDPLTLLISQFRSPIILILVFAAVLSLFLGDAVDAIIILAIVVISGLLGFWQERGAADVVQGLLALVEVKARVVRDGKETEIPAEQVVPGDIVLLSAGGSISGDCMILKENDLFVDERVMGKAIR